MYGVLQLLVKYGVHFLFIVLQIICFTLIINYNKTQNEIFFNSSNVYIAKIGSLTTKAKNFANIGQVNDSLQRENANLIENLIRIEYINENIPSLDSFFTQYSLIPTTICNNTFHLRNNHLTLCKGEREGIQTNMGVISDRGIVGIIRNTSENYAHVISILHSQTRISCAIKSKKGFGNLVWKNMDPLRMTMESLPKHESVTIGDTIITSGYSTMFPKGILIGKVESFLLVPGSNSYEITVKLFKNPTSIQYAYVIQNRFGNEQTNLENQIKNE